MAAFLLMLLLTLLLLTYEQKNNFRNISGCFGYSSVDMRFCSAGIQDSNHCEPLAFYYEKPAAPGTISRVIEA